MAEADPSWMLVTDEFVFAGRVGDGAKPFSTLVRIDRVDLSSKVIVMPCRSCAGLDVDWPPSWGEASLDRAEELLALVHVGEGGTGVKAESWMGQVTVDLDGIREAFEAGET